MRLSRILVLLCLTSLTNFYADMQSITEILHVLLNLS